MECGHPSGLASVCPTCDSSQVSRLIGLHLVSSSAAVIRTLSRALWDPAWSITLSAPKLISQPSRNLSCSLEPSSFLSLSFPWTLIISHILPHGLLRTHRDVNRTLLCSRGMKKYAFIVDTNYAWQVPLDKWTPHIFTSTYVPFETKSSPVLISDLRNVTYF